MPGRHLPLERGGDRRLRVRWEFGYRNVRAELDGREVLRVDEPEQLREGRTAPLLDGTRLELRLERVLFPALVVERGGVPVPGSDTDPGHVARVGAWVLFFIAAVFFLGGVPALMSDSEILGGGAVVGLVITAVFGTLGVLLRRGHAWAALVGIVLETLDGLHALTAVVSDEGTWFGVVARAAFVVILLRAWLVLRRARGEAG